METIVIIPPRAEIPEIPLFFNLSFEGEDGSTEIRDTVSALIPTSVQNCEIDTAQSYSGLSSLRLFTDDETGWGWIQFTAIPGIDSNAFRFKAKFRFSSLSEDDSMSFSIGNINGEGSLGPEIGIQFSATTAFGDLGVYLVVFGKDKEGVDFVSHFPESPAEAYSPDVWHGLELSCQGRVLSLKVDEVPIGSWTASIDNPMGGTSECILQVYHSESEGAVGWMDDVLFSG
jgi:hypothetical protein